MEKYILHPRDQRGSAGCGSGRVGAAPYPASCRTVTPAGSGPWWGMNLSAMGMSAGTATQAGWPTLAVMTAWRMSAGLRLIALLNRMAPHRCRQGATRLLRLNHRTLAAGAGDSGEW